MDDGLQLCDHRFHLRHSGTLLQPTPRLRTAAGHGENCTGVRATFELDRGANSTERTLRPRGQFSDTVRATEHQTATAVQKSPTNIYTWTMLLLHVCPKSGVDQPEDNLTITRRYANRYYFHQVGMLLNDYGSACSKAPNLGEPDAAVAPRLLYFYSAERHARAVATRNCLAADPPSLHALPLKFVNNFSDIVEKTTRLERTARPGEVQPSSNDRTRPLLHLVREQLHVIYPNRR